MNISTHKYIPNLLEDGSLDKQDAMAQSVGGFKAKKVYDIQKLASLVSKNIVYAPIHFRGNYRKKENAILDIDLMVFDIDDGKTMDAVLDSKLGQNYEVLLLKTASWTAIKEKFRVFIPLKTPIAFSDIDEYREFYKFIDRYYGLNGDDKAMEAGRGYIGIKGKEAIISAGEKWIDLTKMKDKIMKKIRRDLLKKKLLQEKKDEATKRYRILNNIKVPTPSQIVKSPYFLKVISSMGDGNHYGTVFSLLKHCREKGMSASEAAEAILLLNISGEYSDKNDLIKKFNS
ncbi:hypothetical protein JHD48_10375 [Sulfurimonas sp. SAG-AH-194-I05]|nr:hypothetical protein [Sulfurimonas sp. SAG-AH-194-I05]MDF1876137.1 hypothetical protein [Sulfurimonas sp. SAG-AH-194-I05]